MTENQEESKKYYLWLSYRENRSGGYLNEPEERWSSRSPTYNSVFFERVTREEPKDRFFDKTSFEVSEDLFKSKDVFLLIVRHSDGDTFGTTYGLWHLDLVTNDQVEVLMRKKQIEEEYEEYKKSRNKKINYEKYEPWYGYFSSLEDIEIHKFTIGSVESNIDSSIIVH